MSSHTPLVIAIKRTQLLLHFPINSLPFLYLHISASCSNTNDMTTAQYSVHFHEYSSRLRTLIKGQPTFEQFSVATLYMPNKPLTNI